MMNYHLISFSSFLQFCDDVLIERIEATGECEGMDSLLVPSQYQRCASFSIIPLGAI